MSLPWIEEAGIWYYPNGALDQDNVLVYASGVLSEDLHGWRVYKKSVVWRRGKADTVEEAKRQAAVAWVEFCLTERAP